MRNSIVFILYSPFPNYTGGRETWLYNLTISLCKRGYEVKIYTFKDDSYPISFCFPDKYNIKIIRTFTLDTFSITKIFSRNYFRIFNFLLFNIQVFSMCLVNSKDTTYIALGPIIESMALALLKKVKKNIRYLCSVRGLHAFELSQSFPRLKKIIYQLEKMTIEKAEMVFANGFDTQEYISKIGYKSYVLPNGVNFKKFSTSSDDIEDSNIVMNDTNTFYIVSTATLQDIKGIKPFIKSLGMLKKMNCKKFKAIWVGKGSSNKYNDLIRKEDVSQYIIFTGERTNTCEFLQKANAVACLSGGAGMSMALLEAMASSKIIVAWDTPVYRQLIKDRVSGFLVEKDNHIELAKTLNYIINGGSSLEYIGVNAKEIAKEYDWENVTSKLLNYIGYKEDRNMRGI